MRVRHSYHLVDYNVVDIVSQQPASFRYTYRNILNWQRTDEYQEHLGDHSDQHSTKRRHCRKANDQTADKEAGYLRWQLQQSVSVADWSENGIQLELKLIESRGKRPSTPWQINIGANELLRPRATHMELGWPSTTCRTPKQAMIKRHMDAGCPGSLSTWCTTSRRLLPPLICGELISPLSVDRLHEGELPSQSSATTAQVARLLTAMPTKSSHRHCYNVYSQVL